MNLSKKIEITKEKLLLVEGKDEEIFFEVLLERNNINYIQIISFQGRNNLNNNFKALMKTPGFAKVIALAIIQDADNNASDRFKSVSSVLKNNGYECPSKIGAFSSKEGIKTGIFVIADKGNQGMLESLCLNTIESNDIMKCIDNFMKCAKDSLSESYQPPKNIWKARCRAFLSVMEENTPSLGIAAKKGYWNFNSDCLNSLIGFLKQI